MATRKRLRLSVLLELFLDSALLLLFVGQSFLLVCIWIYGYLPLPTDLCNRLIAERIPAGYVVTAGSFQLRPDGAINLRDLEVLAAHLEQPLFTAELSEIKLSWSSLIQLPTAKHLVLSGGTLYVPAIYSPNGLYTPLVERIAFRLKPNDVNFQVDRFAALHDKIHLNGAFDVPSILSDAPAKSPEESVALFYKYAAKLLQQKQYTRYFETPTVLFRFFNLDSNTQELTVRVSSRTFRNPEAEATNVDLQATLLWNGETLTPTKTPLISASRLTLPGYQASATDLFAQISTTSINSLLAGNWPKIKVAAQKIKLLNYNLDAPILTIELQAFPKVRFLGSTRSLEGVIELSGALDAHTWEGNVHARGSVDLDKIAPESIAKHLPKIEYEISPYYDLNLHFTEGFDIEKADLRAQVDSIHVAGLDFNHFNARASYRGGTYTIEDLYIHRNSQWVDLRFTLDTHTNDFRTALIGSAVPYEYNALLPGWWARIFEDIDFSNASYSLGNFIINGNTHDRTKIFYYGRAEARGVSYKDVLLDTGSLIVRGRDGYTELHDLDVTSGQGWAKGDISFASMPEIKGKLASVRLDIDAKLKVEDAAKLLDQDIAEIINDFSTDKLIDLKLKGAIFSKQQAEYTGKTYFDVYANSPDPIQFKETPFDHLSFELYGRSEMTALRNINFGYADGHGIAEVDISTADKEKSSLRYHIELVDADQDQAVRDLPHLDKIEDSLDTAPEKESNAQEREEARLDLIIHGEGPIDDSSQHSGFGLLEIRSQQLGTIQLLGPLSRLLQKNYLNFTSLNLNTLNGDFTYFNNLINFEEVQIDGPLIRIEASGTLSLSDQAIDARVNVYPLGNTVKADSKLRKIGDFIAKPLPNLLEFELTGTVEEQKIRSLYDPRNLIPSF